MNDLEFQLRNRYGVLMSFDEAASVLKFTSANALRMALRRKNFELSLVVVPGRRGKFLETEQVATLVQSWLRRGKPGTVITRESD